MSGELGVRMEKMPHRMILIELYNAQAETGLRDLSPSFYRWAR